MQLPLTTPTLAAGEFASTLLTTAGFDPLMCTPSEPAGSGLIVIYLQAEGWLPQVTRTQTDDSCHGNSQLWRLHHSQGEGALEVAVHLQHLLQLCIREAGNRDIVVAKGNNRLARDHTN